MRRVLERQGYSVLLAASGPEALSLLQGTHLPVDLLITDVQMPVLPGDALVQEVRRSWPELPVLYVSGEPDFANLPEATSGPSRFLRKPYTPEELLESVLRLLAPQTESVLEIVESTGPQPDQHAPSLL
jgi:two-component system cell cycle sensor histidine kinase/response regulator CckA